MRAIVIMEFESEDDYAAFCWNAFEWVPNLVDYEELETYEDYGRFIGRLLLEFEDMENFGMFNWNVMDWVEGLLDWETITIYD